MHERMITRCICLLAPMFLTAACSTPAQPTLTRAVELESGTQRGEPVIGTRVWADGRELGLTRDDGRLPASLRGRPGDTVVLTWSCPPAYRSEGDRRSVVLSEMGAVSGTSARPLALRLGCEPIERQAALVVRASGAAAAGIPIRIRDEVVGQTDADGVAHVLLRARPGSTLRVALDTSRTPELRPASPVQTFHIGEEDGVLLFAQSFERPAPKPRTRQSIARPPAPTLPYRIR